MAIKKEIQYEIIPTVLDLGQRWVSLLIKNVSDEELSDLDLRLNSLNDFNISVIGTGRYINILKPGVEILAPFRVSCFDSAHLYFSLDGFKGEQRFYWESLPVFIKIGEPLATITSFFALGDPYQRVGDRIVCEVTVKVNSDAGNLRIEIWNETPLGEIEEIKVDEIGEVKKGETITSEIQIELKEEGLNIIHCYLFNHIRKIGYASDTVYVKMIQV